MSDRIETVRVDLGERSYTIEIGTDLAERLGPWLLAGRPHARAVVITDQEVFGLYGSLVRDHLEQAGVMVETLTVPPGERSKCAAQATALWEQLCERAVDRQTCIVALGGGVIGDLAGFVAATYARGLPLYQIPTTLLAQVDSSVGGKVGINLPGAKNVVGAFWQPRGVLIDTALLQSLPEREYRAGLAEVVKYGVILDSKFFAWLEENADPLIERQGEALRHVVKRSCELKAYVVERDEREETGLRAVLNYGHTFCHALETVTGYQRLLHGEAVSIGMLCASRLAERLGRIDAQLTRRQHDLLVKLGLPVKLLDVDVEAMLSAMSRDKKTQSGRLRFVLPRRLGEVELVDGVDPGEVRGVLQSS